jgi:glutathione S-transferase
VHQTAPQTAPALTLCELSDAGPWGLESFSPFCLKAHRALRLAGLRYERRHGAQPASHRAMNPLAQVPVLLVDGRPVADSTTPRSTGSWWPRGGPTRRTGPG